jgi:hypothetical protein
MKKITLFLTFLGLYLLGNSQTQVKKIDSLVKSIDAQKTLKTDKVCDTFKVDFSELSNIECARFYSLKGKLVKVIYSQEYHHKDTTRKNIHSQIDVFYYNNGLLIKVVSKDFDQSPPKDSQIYFNESHRKKYDLKKTINASKYDGVDYFIEFGYNFLDEFKQLKPK